MNWESSRSSERRARIVERILLSIAGGVAIPGSIFHFILLLSGTRLLNPDSQLATLLSWLIEWPEYLSSKFITLTLDTALLILVLGNFIGYSLFSYIVLWLRDRRRMPKLP